jgi:hypothetical protein
MPQAAGAPGPPDYRLLYEKHKKRADDYYEKLKLLIQRSAGEKIALERLQNAEKRNIDLVLENDALRAEIDALRRQLESAMGQQQAITRAVGSGIEAPRLAGSTAAPDHEEVGEGERPQDHSRAVRRRLESQSQSQPQQKSRAAKRQPSQKLVGEERLASGVVVTDDVSTAPTKRRRKPPGTALTLRKPEHAVEAEERAPSVLEREKAAASAEAAHPFAHDHESVAIAAAITAGIHTILGKKEGITQGDVDQACAMLCSINNATLNDLVHGFTNALVSCATREPQSVRGPPSYSPSAWFTDGRAEIEAAAAHLESVSPSSAAASSGRPSHVSVWVDASALKRHVLPALLRCVLKIDSYYKDKGPWLALALAEHLSLVALAGIIKSAAPEMDKPAKQGSKDNDIEESQTSLPALCVAATFAAALHRSMGKHLACAAFLLDALYLYAHNDAAAGLCVLQAAVESWPEAVPMEGKVGHFVQALLRDACRRGETLNTSTTIGEHAARQGLKLLGASYWGWEPSEGPAAPSAAAVAKARNELEAYVGKILPRRLEK